MAINEDIDLWLRIIKQKGPQMALAAPLVIYDNGHGGTRGGASSCQVAPRRDARRKTGYRMGCAVELVNMGAIALHE